MPRQQRGAAWRGQVPFKALAVAPPLLWQILVVDGTSVLIGVTNVTGTAFLASKPGFREGNGIPITAVALSGPNGIALTLASPALPQTVILLDPFDAGWRTDTGSFLAASRQVFPEGNGGAPGVSFIPADGDPSNKVCNIVTDPTNPFNFPAAAYNDWCVIANQSTSLADATVTDGISTFTVAPATGRAFRFNGTTWA